MRTAPPRSNGTSAGSTIGGTCVQMWTTKICGSGHWQIPIVSGPRSGSLRHRRRRRSASGPGVGIDARRNLVSERPPQLRRTSPGPRLVRRFKGIIAHNQTGLVCHLTYRELRDQVARARVGLVRLGVGRGDRVAANLPNITETVVAFLATASLGAVWSSCPPEFGTTAIVDRLRQIEPKVLLVVDGYSFGDTTIDLRGQHGELRRELPSVTATVLISATFAEPHASGEVVLWSELLSTTAPLEFDRVPFDHPLYILYSSGTTGLPKPIVHGHGGMLLTHLKDGALHLDVKADDRLFWYTTTGWMMWNTVVSGLLSGAAIVLFDGNPVYPDLGTLWRLAATEKVTHLGVNAAFLMACRTHGVEPTALGDLSALRFVGSTGSPLPPAGYEWVHQHLDRVMLGSVSGGTDVCSILVGCSPITPVWSGEMSCRALGVPIDSFNDSGEPVRGIDGELVITGPVPAMPVGLYGDHDGSRYRSTWFDTFPGVWRQGDWITITDRGSTVISGRSDATLNRGECASAQRSTTRSWRRCLRSPTVSSCISIIAILVTVSLCCSSLLLAHRTRELYVSSRNRRLGSLFRPGTSLIWC